MNRRRFRCATGQALILVALAMPLFFSVVGLVIDGSNLMVHRRMMQNAADGAALAASQDLDINAAPGVATCSGTWNGESTTAVRQTIVNDIETYSANNKGPATLDGGSCSHDPARCAAASDRNCYTWPYKGNNGLIEVRLRENVDGFITGVIDALFQSSLGNVFKVSARSVASAAPVTSTTTIPGTTSDGFTDPGSTITGGTHTTTIPDTNLGGNGVAFLMSRNCNAITYQGAGAKNGDPALGAFATNGGLDFQGNVPKKMTALFYNKPGCPNNPQSPPSGTSSCTSPFWGDATESNNACVKTLVDLNQNNTLPITWPLKPPTLPTMLPSSTTWNASVHYPQNCIDAGTNNINAAWASSHVPGVYCRNGSISIRDNLTGGDGYTFFALGGGSISLSSNGTMMKFYWPSACGSRPLIRQSTFSCFSRTLWTNSDWDPQALLYATFGTAGTCAICLTGQNGNLTGDLFAPNPSTFPPGPTQNGGLVHIAGGALNSGSGFIEAWNLDIRGNTGNYQGTGVPIIIPGGTHTTTDPDVTIPGTTLFGTTVAGSTQTQTTGTTLGLDE